MDAATPVSSFTPLNRTVRAAFIGLGRIYDLNKLAYVDNDDVEVVALVDPSGERREQRRGDWPNAQTFASIEEYVASAQRIIDAARRTNRQLRVMENYLFYEPLRKLKEVVDSGDLGEITSYHMKMVASGRGGWEVPGDTYERQFAQSQLGLSLI